MDKVFTLIVITAMLLEPIFLLAWVFHAIRKKPTKKIKRLFWGTLGIFVVSTIVAVSLTCNHEWIETTCSAPRTCSHCGETEGAPLEHRWEEATCSHPKTCILCGLADGEALPHIWVEATCAEPETCSVCGETRGSSLGHTYSEWEIDEEATVSKSGTKVRHCTTCQDVDRESYELESYVVDDKFIFTPEEFRTRFFKSFEDLGYSKFGGAQTKEKDGQIIIDIRDNGYNNVGNIGFVSDKTTWKMATAETDADFDGLVMILSASEDFVANAMLAFIMGTNPVISEYGARQIAQNMLLEETSWAGITYTLSVTGNYYMVIAVP